MPGSRKHQFYRDLSIVCLLLFTVLSFQVNAAPYAYIINQLDHNVSVVDLDSNRINKKIIVGLNSAGETVSPEEKALFVLDAKTHTVVNRLNTGAGSRSFGRFM